MALSSREAYAEQLRLIYRLRSSAEFHPLEIQNLKFLQDFWRLSQSEPHREDDHLVTLTGPGGTGKTRLGLQVAADLSDRFKSGVFFVNLAPLSDPALVVPTIAEALAIREGSGQALLSRLVEYLRPRQMLLLLDNFEHVVSAAEQAADLLTACPQLKVLVTSREVLHVRAKHEFPVPPLAVPDPDHLPDLATLSHQAAVALFLQQAKETMSGRPTSGALPKSGERRWERPSHRLNASLIIRR